jgi:hypothetical protein
MSETENGDRMNTHAAWQARGFRTIPVIPPRAPLANPLNKSLASQRGKAPGLRNGLGRWFGFGKKATDDTPAESWRNVPAPPAGTMDEWGASVGLPCDDLVAWDIDCTDPALAGALGAALEAVAPGGALRVGAWPKRLLLFAAAEPMTKRKWSWDGGAVEMLADGQQFVADGEHPGTGRPYAWPNGRPQRGALAVLTRAQADAVAGALLAVLGAAGKAVAAAATARPEDVPQASLVAPDAAVLEAAVAAMANDGGYDEWIAGLCSIKAASAGLLEDDGRELARGWTERATGGGFGGGAAIDFDSKWNQLRGPFSVGWPQIQRATQARVPAAAMADFAALGVPVAPPGAGMGHNGGPPLDGETGTLQEAAFRNWRWIKSIERFGAVVTGEVATALQFSVEHNWWGAPMSSTKRAAAQFLADPRCKTLVGLTYLPGGPREVFENVDSIVGLCLNTWRPSVLVPRRGVTDEA